MLCACSLDASPHKGHDHGGAELLEALSSWGNVQLPGAPPCAASVRDGDLDMASGMFPGGFKREVHIFLEKENYGRYMMPTSKV
jgi:hypothetical protein